MNVINLRLGTGEGGDCRLECRFNEFVVVAGELVRHITLYRISLS